MAAEQDENQAPRCNAPGRECGLQNITNQLHEVSINTKSHVVPDRKSSQAAIGSWLLEKEQQAERVEDAKKKDDEARPDKLLKYAHAQPPSGPRQGDEGVGETHQRIIREIEDKSRDLLEMQVTLLAAGFVIGPAGQSIRAVCEKSGANIQSCTRHGKGSCAKNSSYRAFLITGSTEQRKSARNIVTKAVELYRKLFTGTPGGSVSRHQKICEIDFYWSPPPRNAVPTATPLVPTSPRKPYVKLATKEAVQPICEPAQEAPQMGTQYPEGTYVAPDGTAFPASYLLQRAAAEQMMWYHYAMPHFAIPQAPTVGSGEVPPMTSLGPAGSHAMFMPVPVQPDLVTMASAMAANFVQQQASQVPWNAMASSSHPAYRHVQGDPSVRAASLRQSQTNSPHFSPSPPCDAPFTTGEPVGMANLPDQDALHPYQ